MLGRPSTVTSCSSSESPSSSSAGGAPDLVRARAAPAAATASTARAQAAAASCIEPNAEATQHAASSLPSAASAFGKNGRGLRRSFAARAAAVVRDRPEPRLGLPR